jgi:hypothetical protein
MDHIMTTDPDVTRTRNLLIWSQTRYHCATGSHDGLQRGQVGSVLRFVFGMKIVKYV